MKTGAEIFMEIKSARKAAALAVPTLLLALGAAACGGGDRNANNANASNRNAANANTANANVIVVTTPTPAAASSEDTALKNEVQANLTKYGVTGVTVETANGEVTLKGNVARAKLQDALKAANDAKPKKVNNQLNIQ